MMYEAKKRALTVPALVHEAWLRLADQQRTRWQRLRRALRD
jgi:hypothetical protein